jgi:hypothetical protein
MEQDNGTKIKPHYEVMNSRKAMLLRLYANDSGFRSAFTMQLHGERGKAVTVKDVGTFNPKEDERVVEYTIIDKTRFEEIQKIVDEELNRKFD